MTFFESIKTVFRKYAEFQGRATRPEFWWFALFSFLVSSALSALLPGTFRPGMWGSDRMESAYSLSMAPMINLAGFWSIAVLLPSLAVTVRRLRDTGREWTNIFWILLPIAGLIVLIVFLAEPTRAAATVTPATPAPAAAPAPAVAPAPASAPAKTPRAKRPPASS